MANQSSTGDRLIDRRTVLQVGAALAIAGPALLRRTQAEAQPRPRGASPVPIIDSQVHAYEANTPKRPWYRVPNWPAHVTGDEMVAAMDQVGVDGAIYVSPFSMYRYDASYAVEYSRPIPTGLRSSSRSTRMIRPWPRSSRTGRKRQARSVSGSF